MFFFKKHKKLDQKQTAMIGFVLAVMSVLTSVIIVYGVPMLAGLLNSWGLAHLDLYITVVGLVLFMAIQGLLLFGFPLFYANDKKDHMTGFQILVYTLLWILVISLVVILSSVGLTQHAAPVAVTDFAQ